jgi:cytochrome c oxidase subunit 2
MAAGAVVVWAAVVGLSAYAIYVAGREPHDSNHGRILIVGGGVVFPTVVLAGLLAYSLALLPESLARAPAGSLRIRVSGEQWWWRVQYQRPGGPAIDLANEIRLPVDAVVEFELTSPDVIHSFWIPALGGKRDMIPGRTNWLTLRPRRTGVFRGACAEYCGASHAWMAFAVVVHEPAEFDRWLTHQATPAAAPRGRVEVRGQEVFLSNGCGACHTVRGTAADGVIGPDLTHVGGRLSLAAGRLENEPADFRAWVARPVEHKPGVHMPAFGMIPAADLETLAAYLESLR